MTFDQVVLVHGGMHASWCWERVLPHLRRNAVAVDLPGRPGSTPVPPTLDSWADTVVQAAANRSAVVAHSLGGLVALAAADRAPERIAGIVLVAAAVPRSGQSYWDLLPRPLDLIRRALRIGEPEIIMPKLAARFLLCNGLDRADRDRISSSLVPEPSNVLGTPVHYRLADHLDLTYVRTARDRMITPRRQSRYIAALPTRTRQFRLECGHSAMYARPHKLAEIINRLL